MVNNGHNKKSEAHKYKKVRFKSGYIIFKCEMCGHFIREELVNGRLAYCWRCGNVFRMTEKSHLLKPHCQDCTNYKKKSQELIRTGE